MAKPGREMLKLVVTTNTEELAIAAPAIRGLSRPRAGAVLSAPATTTGVTRMAWFRRLTKAGSR